MSLDRIRLLVTDVDGVLTDGTVYADADGGELCRYSKRDGVLLPAMAEAGIVVVAMTSERLVDDCDDPLPVPHARRCKKLGLRLYTCGPLTKVASLMNVASVHAVPLSEVAYIGDDLPDLPCLEAVAHAGGAAFVPRVSPARDRDVARLGGAMCGAVSPGGEGCLRDVCAILLTARGYDCNTWPVVKR